MFDKIGDKSVQDLQAGAATDIAALAALLKPVMDLVNKLNTGTLVITIKLVGPSVPK